MKRLKYIFTVNNINFESFKDTMNYLKCTDTTLEKAIENCEENGVCDFNINNKIVNIEIIKCVEKYIKYMLNDTLFVYLLYKIHIDGEKELIRTYGKEAFEKLDVDKSEIEVLNYY